MSTASRANSSLDEKKTSSLLPSVNVHSMNQVSRAQMKANPVASRIGNKYNESSSGSEEETASDSDGDASGSGTDQSTDDEKIELSKPSKQVVSSAKRSQTQSAKAEFGYNNAGFYAPLNEAAKQHLIDHVGCDFDSNTSATVISLKPGKDGKIPEIICSPLNPKHHLTRKVVVSVVTSLCEMAKGESRLEVVMDPWIFGNGKFTTSSHQHKHPKFKPRGGDLSTCVPIEIRLVAWKNPFPRPVTLSLSGIKGSTTSSTGIRFSAFMPDRSKRQYKHNDKNSIIESRESFLKGEYIKNYSNIKTREDILDGCREWDKKTTYVPLVNKFGFSHITRMLNKNSSKISCDISKSMVNNTGFIIETELLISIVDSIEREILKKRKFVDHNEYCAIFENPHPEFPFDDLNHMKDLTQNESVARTELRVSRYLYVEFVQVFTVVHGGQ